MESKAIDSISKSIYRRFPEVDGVKPNVRKQPIPASQKKSSDEKKTNYLLTYKNNVQGPGGRTITRIVRVVATSSGKIIKTTTSK
jgi:hypothetical protein